MYNSQLDTFIKVADLGSFNKAADAMFISSSAIIQQINLLENRCGFKLFHSPGVLWQKALAWHIQAYVRKRYAELPAVSVAG